MSVSDSFQISEVFTFYRKQASMCIEPLYIDTSPICCVYIGASRVEV